MTEKEMHDTWRLVNITDIGLSGKDISAEEKLIAESINASTAQKGLSYSFFPDGKVSEFFGAACQSGKWQLSKGGKAIQIIFDEDGLPLILSIQSLENEFLMVTGKQLGAEMTMKLRKDGGQPADPEEDPLHPANNLWRKKATTLETDEQLKDRLKNLVRHYIYILKKADDNKAQVVSFQNSKSIIKIYRGGIGIQPDKYMPEEWLNTFYDEAQSKRAIELFEEWLDKTPKQGGASAGNWIKDDLSILKAMYAVKW